MYGGLKVSHMTPTNFILGRALANFIKSMKARLHRNWLSILAEARSPPA